MLARYCGCSPFKSCRFSWTGLARAICEMGHNLHDYDVRAGDVTWFPADRIGLHRVGASWIRPHLMHLSVQCSKPVRAAVMRWTSVRDWHLGQRGRAARGDRVCLWIGQRCPPVGSGQNAAKPSLSPMGADGR
jgi:hypothetical protein